MKTVSADYNSMTEAGHIRMALPCSEEGIQRLGLRPGDWVWLSDTEVIVGAKLAVDDRYGLVAVPDWDTVAHLDDEGGLDLNRIKAELSPLLSQEPPSIENEPRILELLIQLEHAAPPGFGNDSAGTLSTRRALALRQMGKPDLALLEIKDGLSEQFEDPAIKFVYLDILRQADLPTAVREATATAERPDVETLVLSACINILSAHSEKLSGEEFVSVAQTVLGWCRRLDRATDLGQLEPSLVALSFFNRGLIYLHSGRNEQSRQAFELAHQLYPDGPSLDQLRGLESYDEHALEVVRQARTAIVRRGLPIPAAA